MRKKPRGWVKEPVRHGLAAKGVKTGRKATVRGVTYREDSGVMMEPLLKAEMEEKAMKSRKGLSRNSKADLERMQRLIRQHHEERYNTGISNKEYDSLWSEAMKIFQRDFPAVKKTRYLINYDMLDWAEVNLPKANYVLITHEEAMKLNEGGVPITSFKAISKRNGRSVTIEDFWGGPEYGDDSPRKLLISYLIEPHYYDLGGVEVRRDVGAMSHYIFIPRSYLKK
jgi:hypothetical protein